VSLIGLDPISTGYCSLAFKVERLFPGFVDAYVGPPGVRAMAELAPEVDARGLLAQAQEIGAAVAESELPEGRKRYLGAQLRAVETICRMLAGDGLAYREEVCGCLDIVSERTPEADFDAAISELDDILPGEGSVQERMIAFRDSYRVDIETARRLIDLLLDETRRRTAAFVDLPEGESVEIAFVTDKPWGGYNWYLGGARSRVEVNTDLPIYAHRLPDLIAHEAYPGHHAEHSLKDVRLYRERGYGEHAIHLINTPECVISEGIATSAYDIVFPEEEAGQWEAEALTPAAGLRDDRELRLRVMRASETLRTVSTNAALLVHEEGRSEREVLDYLMHYGLSTEEKARQQLAFITDPLWRPYSFTYTLGRDLVQRWLGSGTHAERQANFRRLLTEQMTPSDLAAG
jgi:hypothetical protein